MFEKRSCLNLISAIILLLGFGTAVLVYQRAEDGPAGVLGYEEGGGAVYPVMPGDSKKYMRDLELYGGTANVLADQFRRWFSGLWHGRSLAFAVACLTILVSFGLFYAANHLPSRLKSDLPGKNGRDGPHPAE